MQNSHRQADMGGENFQPPDCIKTNPPFLPPIIPIIPEDVRYIIFDSMCFNGSALSIMLVGMKNGRFLKYESGAIETSVKYHITKTIGFMMMMWQGQKN